jgi:hypothetical protein
MKHQTFCIVTVQIRSLSPSPVCIDPWKDESNPPSIAFTTHILYNEHMSPSPELAVTVASAGQSASCENADLVSVGPFFLGTSLSCIGMGAVLVLSSNYYLSIEHSKLGLVLVSTSLALNIAQTMVDLARGWQVNTAAPIKG